MSIYPPWGRYVYVFTIKYAKAWLRALCFIHITDAPPLNCLSFCHSVILSFCHSFIHSFCHSVSPTIINDKIYKLFMSIYPPGGRYVYVFTIQYASSSQKNSNLGLWYITLLKKNWYRILVFWHRILVLWHRSLVLWYNFWVLIPKKKSNSGFWYIWAKREP